MEAEPEITKPKKASPCETQKAFLAFRPIRQQNYEEHLAQWSFHGVRKTDEPERNARCPRLLRFKCVDPAAAGPFSS
jgi:hypothetical protein